MAGALQGQVAIVTGGGRGIGRAIAQALAATGAAVAVAARSRDQITETVDLIQHAGGRAMAIPTDVADRTAVEHLVAETHRVLGPVDLLVNNAGSCSASGPIWESEPDTWWRDVEINLRGPYLCSRSVLPTMIARGTGRIVTLSSGVAARAMPYLTAYGCSKAAVLQFTESVAAETREHGIRVFAISPGLVSTELSRRIIEGKDGPRYFPRFQNLSPERWLPPDRAADLVVLLASGRADSLSGRFLDVELDDIDRLIEHAEQIEQGNLYTLRLRKLP